MKQNKAAKKISGNKIEEMLDKNEKLLWKGKPKFWPFFLRNTLTTWFLAAIIYYVFRPTMFPLTGFWSVFTLLLFTYLVLIVPVYTFLSQRVTEYSITSRRLFIKKGVIGRDIDIFDYDKIAGVSVNVGILDKLFGAGSIIISSQFNTYDSRKPKDSFSSIDKPYEVFSKLKKIGIDIKADINFPNKLRPKETTSYNTRYTGMEVKRPRIRSKKKSKK